MSVNLVSITSTTTQVQQTLSSTAEQNITSNDSNVKFIDVTNVVNVANDHSLMSLYKNTSPYPDETPTKIAEKTVILPSYSWGVGTGAIAAFEPITTILANSAPHQGLLGTILLGSTNYGPWRYLRCNVRITVKLNATQYHQGTLLVGWTPPGVNGFLAGNKYALSQMNSTVLSACVSDQVTMDIPYYSPRPWYDLIDNTTPAFMPKVWIFILNPLVTSSATVVDAVPITLFGQLTDVVLAGPQPMTSIYTPPLTRPRAVKQSAHGGRAMNNQGIIDYKKVDPNGSSEGKFDPEYEAKQKATDGIILNTIGHGAGLFKPIIESIPFLSFPIKIAKAIFKNLDMPNTVATTQFIYNRPHRGHCLLTGVDNSETLSSFSSASVSKQFNILSSDMKVVEYASLPALLCTFIFQTAGDTLVVPNSPVLFPQTPGVQVRTFPDYLQFATCFYQYWRGSIKYLIQFVGTPFYSCRFRISLSYVNSPPSPDITDGTGYYSRIVDVKGDAMETVVIPHMQNKLWSCVYPVTKPIKDWTYMFIEALTDVQGSNLPADAFYYVNIYRAAGSDYQLSMLSSTRLGVTATKQCTLRARFEQKFDPIHDSHGSIETGFCMSDTSSTISDSLKRYVPWVSPANGQTIPTQPFTSQASPFIGWQLGFAYWRGSRRVKDQGTEAYGMLDADGSSNVLGAKMMTQPTVTSVGEALIPWYCTEAWAPSQATIAVLGTIMDLPQDADCINQAFIAAGDDFVYLEPLPFVIFSTTTAQDFRQLIETPKNPTKSKDFPPAQ